MKWNVSWKLTEPPVTSSTKKFFPSAAAINFRLGEIPTRCKKINGLKYIKLVSDANIIQELPEGYNATLETSGTSNAEKAIQGFILKYNPISSSDEKLIRLV